MILSRVRVPVLSVHRTSIAPKFWIALRRLTMTRLRDIAMAPLARLTVTNHRQHFGCQSDSDGERKHQRLEPIAFRHTIDDRNARHHDCYKADHQPGEAG